MATSSSQPVPSRHVSTGNLPSAAEVQRAVDEAYADALLIGDGKVSDVYPALARVEPELCGVSLVASSGTVIEAGDATVPFALMSVSKPFVLALVSTAIGWPAVRALVGANATGMAFNSVGAIESSTDGRTNPMVNSGAIATSSLVPGATLDERWSFLSEGLSRFAGRVLSVDEEVAESATETNVRNQSIVRFLESRQRIAGDAAEALHLYTYQCSLAVSAHDLAVMGATLADGGVNPLTGERVVSVEACRIALAIMATAGMYETSGDWLCDVGLPGKSGIGGGIVTVSPGKGGMGTYAPPLDDAGNSVRGQHIAAALSSRLGLDLFISAPGGGEGVPNG
jgi:glutaminase